MTTRFGSRGWLGLVLGGVALSLTAQPGAALNYSKHPNDSPTLNAILAKGKISEGDADELRRYVDTLPVKPNTVIYLDSPGGNVHESMELGKFFFEKKIGTYVEAKKLCTSACAIAFFGGRGPDGKPNRIKSSIGKLGLHSFSRDFSNDRRYSGDDMKQVLQRAQTQAGVIAEYFRVVEADQDALRIMLTAPNNEMNFVTDDEAIGLGAQVFDEKTKAMMDPKAALERLAKARADARTAAITPPTKPPERPARTSRTSRTTVTTTPPSAGGADSPDVVTRVAPERRYVPDTTARRGPSSGNADSASR